MNHRQVIGFFIVIHSFQLGNFLSYANQFVAQHFKRFCINTHRITQKDIYLS